MTEQNLQIVGVVMVFSPIWAGLLGGQMGGVLTLLMVILGFILVILPFIV